MSWQSFIDTLLSSGNVSKAAIIGHDGNVWAASPGFTVSPSEGSFLCNAFLDAGSARASGVHLNGQKYFVLRCEDDRIIGKQGAHGVCIYKTGQTIIISLHEEGIQAGDCCKTTGNLADYFNSISF